MPIIASLLPKPEESKEPVVRKAPDGNTYKFPPGTNDAQIERYYRRHGILPSAEVSAAPPKWSLQGIKNQALALRDRLINDLPAIGGAAGGFIGGMSGSETGPGAIVPATIGAGAGGSLGEDIRQTLVEKLHPEERRMGPVESLTNIAEQGGLQSLNEVGGRVGGRLVSKALRPMADTIASGAIQKYPILKKFFAVGEGQGNKAAEHLTAAASNKQQAGVALEAVKNTIDDIGQEIQKMPSNQRNVGGFLSAVNQRKTAMNAESAAAMMPIAGKQTVPNGIANNIRALVRDYMDQTPQGKQQKAYLLKVATSYEKPWTFRQLDELRTDLSSQLAKHRAKGAVSKYTAEKGDLDLAVDNAILDGLRETVYPEMDRAAGKPAGYFENLKGRQSSLITLQEILDKRLRDLTGSQAISEVTPRLGAENISLSAHAGSLPRAGIYGVREALSPTRELKTASKHVSKAFPAVYSQPWENLFTNTARVEEEKPPKKPVAASIPTQ